jgi:hypothetical protein
MADLTTIKRVLGLTDTSKDEVLTSLYANIEGAVMTYIGEDLVPVGLKWIVDEATVMRFNRLGSEHLKSENIDVIGQTYIEDVLSVYKPYLDAYISRNSTTSSKKLKMI